VPTSHDKIPGLIVRRKKKFEIVHGNACVSKMYISIPIIEYANSGFFLYFTKSILLIYATFV